MNAAEIEAAYEAGAITDQYRHELLERISHANRCGRSTTKGVMSRVRIVQHVDDDADNYDVLPALGNLPGAQQRPGMVELFRILHRGAMRNVTEERELEKVDTPSQVESIVRVEVQTVTATAIRDIWQPMKAWFDRDCIVIPCDRQALYSPAGAETAMDGQTPLALLPMSSEFADLFASEKVEQSLALLKRAIEEMGRHFTYAWAHSPAASDDDTQKAMRLMRSLRGSELAESICNGFASGASDVINPLHNVVLSVLEDHGPEAITDSLRKRICKQHEDFSVFQAMFSLDCLAMLEHVLRVPASSSTRKFLKEWTQKWPNYHGKGNPLDCLYDRKYFVVRNPTDDAGVDVPIIDFNVQAFSKAEIDLMSSRKIRLGCPSLGAVHRTFTRAMCNAYFGIVWPQLVRQYTTS